MDAGLLGRYLGQGVPENLRVVHRDGGDRADVRLHQPGGVEPPPRPVSMTALSTLFLEKISIEARKVVSK